MRKLWLLLFGIALCYGAKPKPTQNYPAIYIEPQQNGFESYISAAIFKKHVQAVIAANRETAQYILKAGAIATQEEKSGLGKLARCAYAFCIGIDGSQTVSVQLMETGKQQTVWAYSVRKVGTVNYQSSAEAIAKHLKSFLKRTTPQSAQQP